MLVMTYLGSDCAILVFVKDSEGLLDVYGHKLLVNLGNSAAIIVHEFKTIPAMAFFALKTLAECDILVLRFHKN